MSNTEQMVSELLSCPFCKAAMRIESNRDWHRVMGDHDEECVFLDPETMMVPATDEQRDLIVRDWNRRAQPAAQYQGEPVAWRGCNADGEVVTEWIDGVPPERMTDLCGAPGRFDKIELAYAHPAPAMQKGEPAAFEVVVSGYTILLTKTADKAEKTAQYYRALSHMVDIRPLYTHPDAGEIERLRAVLKRRQGVINTFECEVAGLRAQSAERDALLREVQLYDQAQRVGEGFNLSALLMRIDAALSASAEPKSCGACAGCTNGCQLEKDSPPSDAVIPASVGPSAPKRETCESCYGEGVVHTGVEESPTTLCNRCDGSGNEPSAPDGLEGVEDLARRIAARVKARDTRERKP